MTCHVPVEAVGLTQRFLCLTVSGRPWATWVLAATTVDGVMNASDGGSTAAEHRLSNGYGGPGDSELAMMVAHTDRGHANEKHSRMRQIPHGGPVIPHGGKV